MSENKAKGEMHGCVVCGKLYQLLVVHDDQGNYVGSKVMTAGGREVKGFNRPLVACEKHSEVDVQRAANRVYGEQKIFED